MTALDVDPETKRGWDEHRESRMQKLKLEIEDLIEMHDRYGDSLQKSYLWKAKNALKDGLGWFEWSRRRND